jgi:hypothetical protein
VAIGQLGLCQLLALLGPPVSLGREINGAGCFRHIEDRPRTFLEHTRNGGGNASLYAARIDDLGQGDFVKLDCAAGYLVALLAPEFLLRLRLSLRPRCSTSKSGSGGGDAEREDGSGFDQMGAREEVIRVSAAWNEGARSTFPRRALRRDAG